MGWPYEFLSLSKEEVLLRREALDSYARIAHYSAFAPAAVFLLIRLARKVAARSVSGGGGGGGGRYVEVPGSPAVKARRGVGGGLAARWRVFVWWAGDDVSFWGVCWGQRDEWVVGLVWTAWLLVLCVLGTGRDYLHLTKRFGLIAVSQMPIQYLLSLKALNPYAWALSSSHEHINRYHRVLGRIIYGLLILHAVFYDVFFILSGIFLKRFFAPVVFFGVLASLGFHALTGTAAARVRHFSYRLFFVTHLVAAFLVPVLVFFHARSARLYMVESVVIFIVDLAVRKAGAVTAPSVLETIPGTHLVKVSAPMPVNKSDQFRALPGSHIYLSIPPQGRTDRYPASRSGIFDFLYNPFTVASVSEHDRTITFVARKRGGPMTNVLADFASAPPSSPDEGTIPLAIEGPYGAMGKHFHHLMGWGATRVLLIAGGVGATFTLPIYHAIQHDMPSTKVQFIWAIRGAGDATWAITGDSAPSNRNLLQDENVQLYLTGDVAEATGQDDDGAVELDVMVRDPRLGRFTSEHSRRRPDIERIVDDTFRHGAEEKIAVLVCGPDEMAREVRRRVRPWVMKGRHVWWHNEGFGW